MNPKEGIDGCDTRCVPHHCHDRELKSSKGTGSCGCGLSGLHLHWHGVGDRLTSSTTGTCRLLVLVLVLAIGHGRGCVVVAATSMSEGMRKLAMFSTTPPVGIANFRLSRLCCGGERECVASAVAVLK